MAENADNRVRPAAAPSALRSGAIDETAFAALHERYHHGLRTFLLKRTGNRLLAEELAQDAWGEAWRAVRNGQYDPQRAAFSTFLYAIGYKRFLQHRRQAGRRGTTVGGEAFDDTVARLMDLDGTPNESAEFAELLDALRGCLSQASGVNVLSERERAVLDGLSAGQTERDVATDLGIAPSTAHDAKKNAYQKLRRCLAAKGYAEPTPSKSAASAKNPLSAHDA